MERSHLWRPTADVPPHVRGRQERLAGSAGPEADIFLLSDGGLHISYERGVSADHYVNLPLGEVYAVGVDMDHPYNIYAGLQDHESWKGPTNSWRGEIGLEDWETVGTGDGMYNQVDPSDSRWLYNTQEFGTPRRVDQRTRTRKVITPPRPDGSGPLRFNWRADAFPVGRSRRHVDGDQPGSDDQR